MKQKLHKTGSVNHHRKWEGGALATRASESGDPSDAEQVHLGMQLRRGRRRPRRGRPSGGRREPTRTRTRTKTSADNVKDENAEDDDANDEAEDHQVEADGAEDDGPRTLRTRRRPGRTRTRTTE